MVIKRQEVMRMGKDKRDIYIRPGKTALKLATNIFVDIVAGLLIGFGTYNFTVALEFPMVGIGGIALIFITCSISRSEYHQWCSMYLLP